MASVTVPLFILVLVFLSNTVKSQMSPLYIFNMLCTEDHNLSFLRAVPWSCSQYLVCASGIPFTGQCPRGLVFHERSLRCRRPVASDFPRCHHTFLNDLTHRCQEGSRDNTGSPFSCSQYLRCRTPSTSRTGTVATGRANARTLELVECPYPYLFSETTKSCQRFDTVACEGKPVPKAPCDYFQYKRLCDSPGCPPCSSQHPSCVGLGNGFQPLPGKPSVYLACFAERTLDVRQCDKDQVFSQSLRSCVKSS